MSKKKRPPKSQRAELPDRQEVSHVDKAVPHSDERAPQANLVPPHTDVPRGDLSPTHLDTPLRDAHQNAPFCDTASSEVDGEKTSSKTAVQQISTALNTFGASLAERDASHAATMNGFAEGVAQLSKGVGENLLNMATAISTNLAQRDAMHAATMNNLSASLAQQETSHQQLAEGVAQLSKEVGESFGHMARAMAATMTQLQEQIQELEACVADMQARIQSSKPT